MKVEAYQPGTEQARNCNLKKRNRKEKHDYYFRNKF